MMSDTPRKELWIIEALGKKATMSKLLAELNIEATVYATLGHFMSMPKDLMPLGIDKGLRDYSRAPRDLAQYKRIRDMAREASKVVVATDADTEGEVIAWDVAEAVADIHPDPVRVRLKGIDLESLREAIEQAGPVRKEDAIAGRTRAIIDRMIASTFSQNGVAVGRVRMGILGVIAKKKPTTLSINLTAPAKDGGRPWMCQTDIKAPLTEAIAAKLIQTQFPALAMRGSMSTRTSPSHMGDIMVKAADRLDISPSATAKAMQRTYESGRLSYPRAGSRGMSNMAARRMRKALQKSGYKFEESAVAEKTADEVHDAPHPIGEVNTSLDPRKMGEDEGVRTMIARDLIKAGQVHKKEVPSVAVLEAFLMREGFSADVARHVAGLDWRREQGPRYPGQESWPRSEFVERRPDAVLLEAMLETGLGRPSTWANHVDRFLELGLVDQELNLTAKGQQWVSESPQEFLDPRVSSAIEKACERVHPSLLSDPGHEPWEVLADKIVRALPPSLQVPLLDSVANAGFHELEDFRQVVDPAQEPGLDFEALKEEARPGYVMET